MYITEKNLRTADRIVQILIEENYTVKEAQYVLHQVSRDIEASSTVQMETSYQERFSDALEQ